MYEVEIALAYPEMKDRDRVESLVNYCELFRLPRISYFKRPDFSEALIGIDEQRWCAVYEFNAMVSCLVKNNGVTSSQAMEWVTKIERTPPAIVGMTYPVIVHEWSKDNTAQKKDDDSSTVQQD